MQEVACKFSRKRAEAFTEDTEIFLSFLFFCDYNDDVEVVRLLLKMSGALCFLWEKMQNMSFWAKRIFDYQLVKVVHVVRSGAADNYTIAMGFNPSLW